ncbi:MAG: hypothetical protein WCL30_04095 [Pseudomonadota bacterium]
MRISKVSFKDGKIKICTKDGSDDFNNKETILQSTEAPNLDFTNAMSELVEVARAILEFPADYAKDKIKITGVSFSFSETTEVQGAVITGTIALETSNSPFCFNTPHLPYEQYSESGESPTMPCWAVTLLNKLETEAEEFLNGKRGQLSFDFNTRFGFVTNAVQQDQEISPHP